MNDPKDKIVEYLREYFLPLDLRKDLAQILYHYDDSNEDLCEKILVAILGERVKCECGSLSHKGFECWGCGKEVK